MADRYFTVEEANARLDRLREVLPRIREARRVLLASGERVRGAAGRDGGGREGAAYWTAVRTIRDELEELSGEGIVLRDAESGLVDFPAKREGRDVYLCWRLGEEAVAHWHDVDGGFVGRKPL